MAWDLMNPNPYAYDLLPDPSHQAPNWGTTPNPWDQGIGQMHAAGMQAMAPTQPPQGYFAGGSTSLQAMGQPRQFLGGASPALPMGGPRQFYTSLLQEEVDPRGDVFVLMLPIFCTSPPPKFCMPTSRFQGGWADPP